VVDDVFIGFKVVVYEFELGFFVMFDVFCGDVLLGVFGLCFVYRSHCYMIMVSSVVTIVELMSVVLRMVMVGIGSLWVSL